MEEKTVKENKIVLVSLYSYKSLTIRNIYFQLLAKGYDVYCIYFHEWRSKIKLPTEKEYSLLIDILKKINAPIVGISSGTYDFSIAKKIIKRIHESDLKPLILLGGTHAIIKPNECIQYADAVCTWEAEESLVDWCNSFFEGGNYYETPNFWVKKGNDIIKNEVKPIQDLDILALPNFESDNFFYIDNEKLTKSKWRLEGSDGDNDYLTMASRGCPNRCSFCINNILAKIVYASSYKGKYVRFRSVQHVIDELKIVKNHFKDLKRIRFYDDSMGLDRDWLKEFVRSYKKEIGIPFWCQIHISLVDEEIILLLKEAGATKFTIGVESACESFRNKVYHKNFSNKRMQEVIAILKKNNLKFVINMIRNNPLETDEDLREGVRVLLSLRPIPTTFYALTNFPKTELTEKLLEEGIIEKEDNDIIQYSLTGDLSASDSTREQSFRTRRNEYWFYIFNLVNKEFIPKSLILFLTKDRFVKHPMALLSIFRLSKKAYGLKNMIKKKLC